MASLLRKAKHIGKSKVKFKFDVLVQSLSNAPNKISGPVSIQWTRGPRVATTTLAAVDSVQRDVVWNEKLSLVVTLYRKNASTFQEKIAKFNLKEETQRKAQKTHGTCAVNLAEFATADGAPITRNLKLAGGSKSAPPTLKVTIVSNWLKDYTGDEDDTASMMTDISRFSIGGDYSEALSTERSDELAGFDLDDDLGVHRNSVAEGGAGSSTIGSGAPPLPSETSEGDITASSRARAGVSGGAALGRSPLSKTSDAGDAARYQHEIADLRQQLTEVTAAKEESAIRTRHEMEQMVTKLRGLEQVKDILEDEIATLKGKHNKVVDDLQADLEREIVSAKKITSERDYLKTRLLHEEEETLRLQKDLNQVRAGSEGGGSSDLATENAKLQARTREMSDEISALRSRIAELEHTGTRAESQRLALETQLATSSQDERTSVGSDTDAVQKLSASEKARAAAEEDLKDITQQLITAKLSLAESAGEVFGLHQQIKNLKKELAYVARGNRALGKRFAKLEVRYESSKVDQS